MPEQNVNKILPSLLPSDYRQKTALAFECTEDYVYKVAAGLRKNAPIFDFLLDLAEEENTKKEIRESRIEALNK